MKFQNPSLNSVMNERKDKWTNGRTHKPKAICSPLFQSWGHKNAEITILLSFLHFYSVNQQFLLFFFLRSKYVSD